MLPPNPLLNPLLHKSRFEQEREQRKGQSHVTPQSGWDTPQPPDPKQK